MDREAHYRHRVEDLPAFRGHLPRCASGHPEWFPRPLRHRGFTFHDRRHSHKLGLPLRRIKVRATGQTFPVRPPFALPYLTGRAAAAEKALDLRQRGVTPGARAYVSGRDAKYRERQRQALLSRSTGPRTGGRSASASAAGGVGRPARCGRRC